jgi:two-component system CheB/CheR fusion protein
MLLNARLIVQKANSEKLILLAIEDITEQSRFYIKENLEIKKAEEKFKGFLESAPDAIVIVNTRGEIQLVNSQTEKLFGYNRKELIGEKVEILIPEKYKSKHQNHRNESSMRIKPRYMNAGIDLFGKKKDGIEFPIEVSLSQLETDEGILVSAAIRDISEQKRISTELSISKKEAEKATKIAEEAVQAKQKFLANMSHEIRTPLNAIIGFTNVVLKTELNAKQKEFIHAIKVSGDALIVLINDILDLAKVDAGKFVFENKPFRMECSIEGMLQIFKTKIEEKKLELIKKYDSSIPVILSGDRARLHQIILNLLSNAIKFTAKGKVTLSVAILDQDENFVNIEFSIKDTGIGISKNDISSIFENFQQASRGTSSIYGGTGLGLAIAKQLIESQGGKIQLISELGKGSTFSFNLKFQKTTALVEDGNENFELDPLFKKIKVLVVEDIPLNQLLMKTLLDDFGFEWEIADNGKMAIEKVKINTYDIILMDLQMPEMNGFEATEYIRKTLKLNIPIIALTADVTKIDLENCKLAGMSGHVSKPVDEKVLYTNIIKVLKKQNPKKVSTFELNED